MPDPLRFRHTVSHVGRGQGAKGGVDSKLQGEHAQEALQALQLRRRPVSVRQQVLLQTRDSRREEGRRGPAEAPRPAERRWRNRDAPGNNSFNGHVNYT